MGSAVESFSEPIPLVAVRPEVMAEAEHAFGNLFHRLHYAAQKLRDRGVEEGVVLEEAVSELEEFLRLTLDYASPLAVSFQRVRAAAVLHSLFMAVSGSSSVDLVKSFSDCYVSADPGRLSRAFQLMAYGLGESPRGERRIDAAMDGDASGRWLTVRCKEIEPTRIGGGRGLVAWALAQKLVDAQGGTLAHESDQMALQWTLRLPISRNLE